MLLIDEDINCCAVSPKYVLADNPKYPHAYIKEALDSTERSTPYTLRLPSTVSSSARFIAYELHRHHRNVYVIEPELDCVSEVKRLLNEQYDGIVIDGKLWLNKEDGEVCTH